MRINELPNDGDKKGLADLAMYRHVCADGVDASPENELAKAFEFDDTPEGGEFWDRICLGDWTAYREKWPEGWSVNNSIDKPDTVETLKRIEDKLGYGGC